MYFSKVTSVKTFVDLSRVDYSGQNKCYHSESFRELNQKENRDLFSFFLGFFFFFKNQFFLGWKKDFGHFRMDTSECVFFSE